MLNKILPIILMAAATQANAITYYVTPTGAGTKTGTSWANAKEGAQLQAVINAAASGSEIWVAAGTYLPTMNEFANANPTNIRDKCFVMKEGVKIYGGFPATGAPTAAQRQPFANKTYLSGELQNDNNISNNSYNVIKNYRNSLTLAAVLDGFWITGGNANLSQGGGIWNETANPSIVNCVFLNNSAKEGAAAANTLNAAPRYTKCVFMNNNAVEKGGVAMINGASVIFLNCLLFNNRSVNGGALYFGSNAIVTFYNGDVHGNTATTYGSFIYSSGSSNRITMYNGIMWSNAGNTLIYDELQPTIKNIQNSIYQGVTVNNYRNLNENPLYVAEWDPDGADDIFGTSDDGLGLSPDSPAIGLGNASNIPATMQTDITGSPRVSGASLDAGAYEYQQRVATETTLEMTTELLVYPNPTHNVLNINTQNLSNTRNTVFSLQNALGATVEQQKWSLVEPIQIVDVSHLPKGIYIYTVQNDADKVSGRIVVE